ncbi:MAG: BMP family ABC transporter substrate-binding protein [Oscillospiraceae bacterium]|nr:BMP family ABC transporter substrate-binding protein [Oscillospiraceae bacterium]MDD4368369.1 BMP family ABC transporter substrate-binding protein [Oscillospiraceae bacterium]
MKQKHLLAAATALALLGSLLTACSSSGTTATTAGSSAAATTEAELTTAAATTTAAAEATTAPATTTAETSGSAAGTGDAALKIVIVTSPSGVDDGSFNEDNYNGILSFIENNPASTVKDIKEPDSANAVTAVANVLADYDVIVTPGYQFAGIYQLAVDNPDKNFILVDSNPSDADGNEQSADNIYAMTFAEQESGFYAGIAAALETQSGKVAVVNGVAYPSNVNYQYGFESGVNYAVKYLNATAEVVELQQYAGTDVTGADVGGNYIGDFSDPATGKKVGEDLLAEGCDILFVAAGNSGNGVFTAVKENGAAKVIGCDVDQYDDGANGSSNIVLTSVLKVMSTNVEKQLQAIADGTFQGGNVVLNATTDSTGYVSDPSRSQLSDSTKTALEDVYAKVKDGSIVPAANFNGYTPEDFPGLN